MDREESVGLERDRSCRNPAKNLWLLSFGDLLTLLLCFFVSLTALGHFTGDLRTAGPKVNPVNHSDKETCGEISDDGTRIAINCPAEVERSAVFRDLDFQDTERGLISSAESKVKNLLAPTDYEFRTVLIETCGSLMADRDAESWDEGIRRALILKRQLVDAGIQIEALRFRTVGPHCESLAVREDMNDAAARIVLKRL